MDLYDLGRKHYIVNLTGKIVIWTGGSSEPIRLKPFQRGWFTGTFQGSFPSYYSLKLESNGEKVSVSTNHVNRQCDEGYCCRAFLYSLLFAILPASILIAFALINGNVFTVI